MSRPTESEDYEIIFRRYRKDKSGKLLDARQFGLKAWPIKVPKSK